MKKLDCIKRGNEQLEMLLNTHAELQEIKLLKEYAISDDVSPNDLADLLVKMSAYLFRIGTLVCRLTSEANQTYMYRKLSYVFEYNVLSNEIKVKDRESMALLKTQREYEDELVARYVADYMKTLYDNYTMLMSKLQSKLALMRNEMSRL